AALARHGKYYADKLYHYYQSVQMPTRILERVEIDHTPLDLILLHDDLLIPLGRAYLTLLVDVFSGCIIGFHLGFKAPSYVSASKAILHSIKKKDYISSLPIELQNEWPCSGKIENLVVDNG
ncbi:transposase, partial [Vibrio anguillarum]|nr:transposase [Vibrio anguillarum]